MNPIMKRLPVLAAALALPLSALPLAAYAAPAQAAPAHKIGMAKAKAIALKAAPGKIVESDFEKENGGWRYSFDIRQGKRIHEIGVDAYTGKIVENSYETAGDKD
jgi:uncharacterized membrane protein YkoI